MAFLAVLREGLETAVFLLSAFQASTNRTASSTGAALGLLLAVGIGFGIYKGGVKINLPKFFTRPAWCWCSSRPACSRRAVHTAHEAGWINVGQGELADLSWLIKPGSVQSALLTGVLGIQPKPTVIEAPHGWLYLVPASFVRVAAASRPAAPLPRRCNPCRSLA